MCREPFFSNPHHMNQLFMPRTGGIGVRSIKVSYVIEANVMESRPNKRDQQDVTESAKASRQG